MYLGAPFKTLDFFCFKALADKLQKQNELILNQTINIKFSLNLYMTIAQRKIELINWISSLTSEDALIKLEELKKTKSSEFPSELLELLAAADQETTNGLRKHTSVKDISR